jgi:hypothetical protein
MVSKFNVSAAALKNGWRSGLEAKVADQLDAGGISYDYEGEKIAYTKPSSNHKYTPDFPLYTRKTVKKIYIETKGRFMADDRKKHILIRKQRPDLDIRFVFSNPNQRISKGAKTTYALWCEKNDFLYAKGTIPEEWLNE